MENKKEMIMRNQLMVAILLLTTLGHAEKEYYPKGTPGYGGYRVGGHSGGYRSSNAPASPQGPAGRAPVKSAVAATSTSTSSLPCGCSGNCHGFGGPIHTDGASPGHCLARLKQKCGDGFYSGQLDGLDFYALVGGDEKCERTPGGISTPPPLPPPPPVRPPIVVKPVPSAPIFVRYVCGGCYSTSSYEGGSFTGRGGSLVYKGCYKVSKRFSDGSEEAVGNPNCSEGTVRGAWEDRCKELKRADTRCN